MKTTLIVVGDWSGDGHEKTESFIIESNLSLDEIRAAYAKGSEILGVDIVKNVCAEYEDNLIPFAIAQKLNFHLKTEFTYDKGSREITPLQWSNLFLGIVKLGSPEFTYEYVVSDNILNIGGYGLFY